MDEAREGAVWVSVSWHHTSNVDVWVFLLVGIKLGIELRVSPVVVDEAGEG